MHVSCTRLLAPAVHRLILGNACELSTSMVVFVPARRSIGDACELSACMDMFDPS
jgi:hypothetical protein